MAKKYANLLLIVASGLLVSPGCANRQGWGWGGSQGSVSRQKARAVYHDPYPINDLAPEVMGGRPRDFMQPNPEPVRNQYIPPNLIP